MNFRDYNQDQGRFLQIVLSKAIEEDHPSRIINDIVESLDLEKIYARYNIIEGNPSYHPKMMLKVLFYAYMKGVFSCRKIQTQLNDYNFPFLYLSGGDIPCFSTINNFRLRHLDDLPTLFTQIVLLCIELGMVDFGFLAIDGQKIHANASFRQSKTREGMKQEIERIEKQMTLLLGKEPGDDEDDNEETRKKELKLLLRKNAISKALSKLEELIAEEKDEDKHKNIRVNITDNDAPVMTHKDSTKKPSYETYAAVDHKYQIITAYDCLGNCNETEQAIPLILQSYCNSNNHYHAVVGLDAGFSSLDNLFVMDKYPFEVLMPDRVFEKWQKDGENMKFHKSKFQLDEEGLNVTCPMGKPMRLTSTQVKDTYIYRIFKGTACADCPAREKCTKAEARTVSIDSRDTLQASMREKLKDGTCKAEYQKRMYTVEPIFGNMQKNSGWKQFHLRGKAKVKGEFGIHAIAHNLKKVSSFIRENAIDLQSALNSMLAKYQEVMG